MAVTVTVADPLTPFIVAVMVAEPGATAETSPAEETVATALTEDAQLVVGPEIGVPVDDAAVAESCSVVPAATDDCAGVTVTVATCDGTLDAVASPPPPEHPTAKQTRVADSA